MKKYFPASHWVRENTLAWGGKGMELHWGELFASYSILT